MEFISCIMYEWKERGDSSPGWHKKQGGEKDLGWTDDVLS